MAIRQVVDLQRCETVSSLNLRASLDMIEEARFMLPMLAANGAPA